MAGLLPLRRRAPPPPRRAGPAPPLGYPLRSASPLRQRRAAPPHWVLALRARPAPSPLRSRGPAVPDAPSARFKFCTPLRPLRSAGSLLRRRGSLPGARCATPSPGVLPRRAARAPPLRTPGPCAWVGLFIFNRAAYSSFGARMGLGACRAARRGIGCPSLTMGPGGGPASPSWWGLGRRDAVGHRGDAPFPRL